MQLSKVSRAQYGLRSALSRRHLQGGETEALARLAEQLSDKAWVAQFEKPKGNPAAFDPKPATTILSPYLKFGCISSRLFYESLQQVSHDMQPFRLSVLEK